MADDRKLMFVNGFADIQKLVNWWFVMVKTIVVMILNDNDWQWFEQTIVVQNHHRKNH